LIALRFGFGSFSRSRVRLSFWKFAAVTVSP
jgi:hypothetical protein